MRSCNPRGIQCSNILDEFWSHALATAALILLLANYAHAQDSQFLFDPNGNLLVQSPEVGAAPQISGQPQNQVVDTGETASFMVVATGTKLLSYQWRFNNASIGATDEALLLPNVGTSSEGQYSVVVSNFFGSVTSAPALLMIDSDHDGMGDSWELSYFGNLNENGTADFDGDGASNRREFQDATDPTNSNSFAFRLVVVRDLGSVIKTPDQPSYTNGQSVTLTAVPPTNGFFHAWLGDIVTRSNPITLVMTNDKTVYARFTPIVFTWVNPASGDWDGATNWKPNLAPSTNDTAIITSSVTVTLNSSADCAAVTLGDADSNPTLTGNGTLTVRGTLSWGSGTMSGNGRTVLEPAASFTLDSASQLFLDSRTLELGGQTSWTTPAPLALKNAVITNRPGAVFEIQQSATVSMISVASRIDNAGIVRKSIHPGTTTFGSGVGFNNYGTVEIETGTLNFAGGGTHTASSSLTGAGHLMFSGGIANVAGLVNVSGSNTFADVNGLVPDTFNFTGNYICTNNTLTIFGNNTVNFSGTGLVSPTVLDFSGGTLTGTSTVTVLGAMNWTGGTMSGSGRTTIAPGVTVNAATSSGVGLSGRTLENGGTILWTGSGLMGVSGGGVITNRAGALFHVQNAAPIGGGGANGRLDNAGTFRKSVNAGTTTFDTGLSLNNFGLVEIQSGTLGLGGGGTHSGSFDVPAGTALILSGGTHSGGASSSITGAGHFTVSGGTANLAGLVNVSGSNTFIGGTANFTGNYICTNNTITFSSVPGCTANFSGTDLVSPAVLNLSGGTLTGTSTVTVLGAMNWTGGTMSGSGRTIIPAGVTLNAAVPSGVTLTSRTLENGGTILWTGAGLIAVNGGGVITNRAGALFHAQNAAGVGGGGANGRLDNAGTFRKSVNAGTTTFDTGLRLNNFGAVEIQTGTLLCNSGFANSGALILSTGTTNRLAGGGSANGTFDTPATALVEWTGGTFTLSTGALLNGAGLYRINGGSLTADANLNVANLDLVFVGSTLGGAGVVTVANVINWTSGTMGGTGRTIIATGATLNLNVSGSASLTTRTLENAGTVLWNGAANIALQNNAVITNRAAALFHVLNAATLFPFGNIRFDNAGVFRKSANTGTTTVGGGMSFNNSGTVDIRSGILAANGGYTSSSNALLNCALGGTTPGTNYGRLQVGGAITLNGGLRVDFVNGFVPNTNDAFTIVTAGARNGTFSNFFYPSNAAAMQLSNTANSVIARVTDVFSVPQPAPVPAGLISWWRAEGNPLDTFGTNHGTVINGTSYATGMVGQAFALDGVNDYVSIPDSPTLRPASVTLESWVKFFATNGIRVLIGKPLGNGVFDSCTLAFQDGAVLGLMSDNSGFGPILVGPANTVPGQWYHLAYTFDDTNKQQVLYVNGISVASGTASKTISYDTSPLLLGADVENGVLSFFLNGIIDEASIYKRALTGDEIATIYNAGAAGKQLSFTPYEQWKQTYLGDPNAPDTGDPDGDGANNLSEFTADTNPTNALSNLRIVGVTSGPAGIALQWQGGILATQFLQRSFSIGPASSWQDLFTNLPPTPSPSSFTNSAGTSGAQFYRIRVLR